MLRRLARHIQAEDIALGAIVLAAGLLSGGEPSTPPILNDNSFLGGFFGGLVSFLAAVGAIAAMATRVPGQSRLETPSTLSSGAAVPVRIWLVGPFIGAVGFVAGDSLDRMGLPGGDVLILVAFVAAVASFVLADHLPVVSRQTRRVLVAPFVLLSGAFIQGLAMDIASGFGGTDVVGALRGMDLTLAVTLLGIVAFIALVLYLALVVAPRELADPGASTASWVIRFAIFYVSLLVAIVVGGSIPTLIA